MSTQTAAAVTAASGWNTKPAIRPTAAAISAAPIIRLSPALMPRWAALLRAVVVLKTFVVPGNPNNNVSRTDGTTIVMCISSS
jgi:hypothetical protein